MADPGTASLPPDAPQTASQPPARLFLVRHGQSTWNRERRIQGQLDPPLSALGRAQAEAVCERLRTHPWTAFYSSDLARCLETAAPLAARLGSRPTPDPGLREIRLGEWEGLTREELVARYPEEWASWRREPDWDLVPGAEPTAGFERRVGEVLAGIMARHPDGDVLVITHGGVIQVALAGALGRPSRGPFPFVVGNASLTVVQRRDGHLLISRVNDTCHLEGLEAAGPAGTALPR